MTGFIVPIQPMQFEGMSAPTSAAQGPKTGGSFSDILRDAVQEYQSANEAAAADSAQLAFGSVSDLSAVQINTMKAESMLQTTVQLTTRAVNAYKEIMQMSV